MKAIWTSGKLRKGGLKDQMIDRISIFVCVLALLSVVSVGPFKLAVLTLCGAYLIIKKRIRLPSNSLPLLLFLLIQLVVHMGSALIDVVVAAQIQVFLFRLAVCILLYNLMMQKDPRETSRLAVWTAICAVLNVFIILAFYLPGILTAPDIATYRLEGQGMGKLFYYSANMLAYMIFAAHCLLLIIFKAIKAAPQQPVNDNDDGSPRYHRWIKDLFVALHLILLFFAVLTRSRGYYLLLALFGLYCLADWFRLRAKRKSKRIAVIILALVFAAAAVIVLTARQSQDIAVMLTNLQKSTPNSVLNRFISLLRLVLVRDRILDASTLERMGLIQYAWTMFLSRPLFGYGLGTFRELVSNAPFEGITAIYHNTYTHVELFEMLAGTGLLGTLLYYLSYLPVISYRRNGQLLFGLMVISILAGFVFRIYYDKLFWWILVAICLGYSAEESNA